MAKLHIIEGPMKGRVFDLEGEVFFIGRAPSNDIPINDETVSRRHIKLFNLLDSYFVEDLKSKNGTFVNERVIKPGQGIQIDDKDIISLGFTKLRVDEVSVQKAIHSRDLNRSSEVQTQKVTESLPLEKRAWSNREIEVVHKTVEILQAPLNIKEFFLKVLTLLLTALPRIDRAAILLFDEAKGQVMETFIKPRENKLKGKYGYSRTIVEQVLKQKTPVVMPSFSHDELSIQQGDDDTREIKSALCVPMSVGERLYGAIYLDGLVGSHAFRKEDLLLIGSLGNLLAFALENSRLSDRLKERI